jgi:hypothetical protein
MFNSKICFKGCNACTPRLQFHPLYYVYSYGKISFELRMFFMNASLPYNATTLYLETTVTHQNYINEEINS